MAVHDARLQVQSVCVFWQTLNKNVAALQDRGHVLHFEPGAAEVLASPAYESTPARVAAFVLQGGGWRATFFNWRRRLQGGGAAT